MILVTGGTGLVGSYLLHALTRRGQKVRALLRPGVRAHDPGQLFECFSPGEGHLAALIEWVEGNVLDPYSLNEAMKGVDLVFHCAAMVSFNPRDLHTMLRVNIDGTANVVNACLANGVKKMCHVSSIAALGQGESGEPADENARWKTSRTHSGYAISKYSSEREVWRGIEEGLNAVIVNPSVIIGAGCQPGASNRIFRNMQKFLPFYTKGTTGYVDVRDVASAMIMLMNSDVTAERFVLNSENLSVREIFGKAAGILHRRHPYIALNNTLLMIVSVFDEFRALVTGSRPMLTRENTRAALQESFYSSEKFRNTFDFRFIPVEQSLRDMFEVLDRLKK